MIDTITTLNEETSPLVVTGALINGENGYPLVGLRVAAYSGSVNTPPNRQNAINQNGEEILLGEGISDINGRFNITFYTTPLVRQQLDLLRRDKDSTLTLKVEIPNRESYLRPEIPVGSNPFVDVNSLVPLPVGPIPNQIWEDFGMRLENARLVQLHDIVHELIRSESGASLLGDWDVTIRHSIITELEHAFLDPTGALRNIAAPPSFYTLQASAAFEQYKAQIEPYLQDPTVSNAFAELHGKLSAFDSLVDVDWVIDPAGFKLAQPAAAIIAFQNLYRSVPFDVTRADIREELGEKFDDPIRYRDYLRTIWTDIALRDFVLGDRDHAHENAAITQLNRRFHQDFRTSELMERPANEILVNIVTEILVASKGVDYGFGIPLASIEPRADQSFREYLDYLISLTTLSAHELGLRYRLNLDRPDTVLSTAVGENISTLQHFFRDSFQCDPEPFPIIPERNELKAPFFLEYEEWLRNKAPFYPENYYRIFEAFDLDLAGYNRTYSTAPITPTDPDDFPHLDLSKVSSLNDAMHAGYEKFSYGQFAQAAEEYSKAGNLLHELLTMPNFKAAQVTVSYYPTTTITLGNLAAPALALFLNRRAASIKTMYDLNFFWNSFRIPTLSYLYTPIKALQCGLVYLAACVLPTALGDLALAQGDYPNAVRYYLHTLNATVGMADTDSVDPYSGYDGGGFIEAPHLYTSGSLPYTFYGNDEGNGLGDILDVNNIALLGKVSLTHSMEVKFFRLRLGNAMLEWADALYRTDDSSNKARARELYKGVLLLYEEMPPISPSWASLLVSFVHHTENPACAGQKVRARLGFMQLEAGLNYFGYDDEEVPTLRYSTLRDAANRAAALAKVAQTDFLTYMEKLEESLKEGILNANLLKKAALQAQGAEEQAKTAEDNVSQAKQQKAQVEKAIEAKKEEIEKKSDFFSQLSDFVSGFKDALAPVPGDAKSFASSGITGGGEGLAAGAGVMGAYGLFVYGSYVSMSAIADAANKRQADLNTLRAQVLPAAEALIQVKQRDVAIARLQKQVAQADANLAHDLITFQATRFLNTAFWSHFTNLMKRVLRRYLELGARMAWLAERALSYEQDKTINIIRFDYFPLRLQGVTGADLLQLDIVELEASRLDGIRQSLPIKHTFSLARDFPVQFGQLKQTGRCSFHTEEIDFQRAYPGAYGYRLRAVTVAVETAAALPPVRGLLTNRGISTLSRSDGTTHFSVRNAAAFPLSEFRLRNDMAIYELPDETLLTFEGSGVETFWEVEFPSIANTYGLNHVADILITLDASAHYSTDLYQTHLATAPTSVQHVVFVSALKHRTKQVDALRSSAPTDTISIDFDLASIGLSKQEFNRKVNNLVIFLQTDEPLDFSAVFRSTLPPTNVAISFNKSVVFSNAPLLASSPSITPLPLNKYVGMEVAQRFSLTIDRSKNLGVDFSGVTDVVLGIEYLAELSK